MEFKCQWLEEAKYQPNAAPPSACAAASGHVRRGSEQTSHATQQTKQFQTRESSVMTGLRSVLCCLPGRSSKRQQQPGGSVARGPFPSDGMLREVGVCTSVAAADHPVITQRVRSVEGKRAFIWPVSGGMCSLG